MKIAVAQINTTIGDLEGNESRIAAAYQRGAAAGADVVVTPELATTGYPPATCCCAPALSSSTWRSWTVWRP